MDDVNEAIDRLHRKVSEHMNWDMDKTNLWFEVKNPLLGESSPNDMILRGRIEKLEKFIDGLIEENFP